MKNKEEAKQTLIASTKIALQVSALTLAYSIGYGCGASIRQLKKLVGDSDNLGFAKELYNEMGNGYNDAINHEEIKGHVIEATEHTT